MIAVYAILGDDNVGKSSMVRALTGVARRKIVKVATTTGDVDVFIQISALQESGISPKKFIAEMSKKGSKYVLVTLWISQHATCPSGADYLSDFLGAGWSIRNVTVLGLSQLSSALPRQAPQPLFIPLSQSMPVNRIASQVRAAWGWL